MGWRTAAIWVSFFAALVAGVAFLLSDDALHQAIGVALLVLPVAVLTALTLGHYWAQRTRPGPPT